MPSTAISTGAYFAAANASVASDNAHGAACASLLSTFNSAGSTPRQRQEYVACVERLEPQELTPEARHDLQVAGGLLLLALLVGAIIGAWRAHPYERLLGAFVGMLGGFVMSIIAVLISALVWFVFS